MSSGKEKILKQWYKVFNEIGVEAEIISKQYILEAFNAKGMLLFIDEDELSGLSTFYSDILGKDFKRAQAKTLNAFVDVIGRIMEQTESDTACEAILRSLVDKGVNVFTIQVETDESIYWKKCYEEINNKFEKIGSENDCAVHEEFWEDFFDDKYTYEYASDIGKQPYPQIMENGIVKLKDTCGKYYNVVNGERRTVGQPETYNNTVYFLDVA